LAIMHRLCRVVPPKAAKRLFKGESAHAGQ
jgi:hypothetical protein